VKIAAVMTVTAPTTTKFWTYYAAVASWSKEVDSVFLVDGHSDEDLLKIPQELFGSFENVTIIREPETFWGSGDDWFILQSDANWNLGVERASVEHDAIFTIGADQVAYPGIREAFDDPAINFPRSGGWFEFWRSKYQFGRFRRRTDKRGIVIIPPTDGKSSNLIFGKDMKNDTIGDFPLRATHKSAFLDPVNDIEKPMFGGIKEAPQGVLDAECGSFGHFWYNMQECHSKIRRWDRSVSRYEGRSYRHTRELYLLNGLYAHHRNAGLDTWDSPELPVQFRKLLHEMYVPGMMGGTSFSDGIRSMFARTERKFWGASRMFQTKLKKRAGLIGLKDQFEWKPLNSDKPTALDLSEAFRRQNTVLK
jgi:hypothetical protein